MKKKSLFITTTIVALSLMVLLMSACEFLLTDLFGTKSDLEIIIKNKTDRDIVVTRMDNELMPLGDPITIKAGETKRLLCVVDNKLVSYFSIADLSGAVWRYVTDTNTTSDIEAEGGKTYEISDQTGYWFDV